MKNLRFIFLVLFALIFAVTEVIAETDKDDPVIQAFWKLMFEPSVENLHAARNTLSQSPGFRPYSKDIYAMMVLSEVSTRSAGGDFTYPHDHPADDFIRDA